MGSRVFSAAIVHTAANLHPRMALLIRGWGQLGAEVDGVKLVLERPTMLGWEGDAFLLAKPEGGRWPDGTLRVRATSQGQMCDERSFVVADSPIEPPLFAHLPHLIAPPAEPPRPKPPFFLPGPTTAQTFIGTIRGSGAAFEVTVTLANGRMLGGWVPGTSVVASYEPPKEGIAIASATVRDLFGQSASGTAKA